MAGAELFKSADKIYIGVWGTRTNGGKNFLSLEQDLSAATAIDNALCNRDRGKPRPGARAGVAILQSMVLVT